MVPRKKIQIALVANLVLLFFLFFLIFNLGSESKYFRFGPQDDFILISVKINTWTRYAILLLIISVIQITEVLIEDLGLPILTFNIYNPDKKVITDFKKMELQIYGNLMFLINNLRYIIQVLVTVTQIDIAIFAVLMAQITGIITVRFLINEKTFSRDIELEEQLVTN